jgi:arylsulfatase A
LFGEPARQTLRDYFYWEAAPQQAVRRGDWKLYRSAPGEPIELYNLAADLAESKNVAAAHPDLSASLSKLLVAARTDSAEFPLQRKQKAK